MHMRPSLSFSTPAARAQRGAALLAALIFLIVFTIIGVGVVGTTTTEEKLARNFRDMDIAFAATEAALRDAEIRINGYWNKPAQPVDPYAFSPDCTNGLCDRNAQQPVHEKYSLTASPSVELGAGTTGTQAIALVSEQPRYLIESTCGSIPGESATKPCQTIYRITSIGFGRLSAQTMLQETYIP
jgi:type IV pilus assembly protein PilX